MKDLLLKMKRLGSSTGMLPEQYDQSYAVDWRFLLPIEIGSKILVVGNGAIEAALVFRKIGLQVDVCNYIDLVGQGETLSFIQTHPNSVYDIIIIPDSSGFVVAQFVSFFQSIDKLLKKNGKILVGFLNSLYPSRQKKNKKFTSTIHMIRKSLINFNQIKTFGCFPDLIIPEYIFPMDSASVKFVLKHRYRYRFPKLLLSFITTPLLLPLLVHFLPVYYILAVSEK